MRTVTATAPGKVNLHFEVGALASDGYHAVSSLYQALDLTEYVSLSTSRDETSTISVVGSLKPEHLALVPTDKANLVVKAVALAAELAGIERVRPFNFQIEKHVPVAGGMAGGSADAAAALVAGVEKFHLDISKDALIAAAVRLGADVPFALLGGTAIGTGRGEELRKLELAKPLHFVMITSKDGLKTPAVYAELDRQRAKRGQDPRSIELPAEPSELIHALATGDFESTAKLIHNDLEAAAIALMPELEFTIAAAERFGASRAFVSGSGPTVAALASSADAAQELASKLSDANFDVFACSSTNSGAELLKD
jgi:4-diphosphocytidyl-2-C-methyl-D-erythritol kinase